MTPTSKSGTVGASKKTPTGIPELIAALANPSPVARRKAREALMALGKPAVPSLIQLLSHRKPHARWEAAKALGGIGDPIAAFALVNALKDRDGDVRWLAAEGLAALGRDALHPLLAALIEQADSDWLCEAHITFVMSWSGKEDLAQSCGLCWPPWNNPSRKLPRRWLLTPRYHNCESCREIRQVRSSPKVANHEISFGTFVIVMAVPWLVPGDRDNSQQPHPQSSADAGVGGPSRHCSRRWRDWLLCRHASCRTLCVGRSRWLSPRTSSRRRTVDGLTAPGDPCLESVALAPNSDRGRTAERHSRFHARPRGGRTRHRRGHLGLSQ